MWGFWFFEQISPIFEILKKCELKPDDFYELSSFCKNLDIEFVNILQKLIVKFTNINFIITYPNNDSGYKYIIQKYLKIQKQNYKNVFIFKSLGYFKFLLFCHKVSEFYLRFLNKW